MSEKYHKKYNKYKIKYLVLKKRMMIDTDAGNILHRQNAGIIYDNNKDKLRAMLSEKDISINFDHNDIIILQILNDTEGNHYVLVMSEKNNFDEKLDYFKKEDFKVIKAKTNDGVIIAYCEFETNPDSIEDVLEVFVKYIKQFYDTSFEFLELYSLSLDGINLNALIEVEKGLFTVT